MRQSAQTFTYTARRGAYLGGALPFLAIVLLEGGLLALLAVVFAPGVLARLLLLGTLVALLLALTLGVLFAALWTRHRLTERELVVRYGFDRVRVSRAAIATARPARERLDPMQLLRARLDVRGGRIMAAFSEEGQVLLTLDRAYRFRVNGARGLAGRILFNVDRRDALLAALGVPAAAGTPAALPPAAHSPAGTAGMAAAASPSSPPATSRPAGGGSAAAEATPDVPRPATGAPADALAPRATVAPPVRATDGAAIRTERLTRRFGGVAVVDALDLAIVPGEIYGFLGPNGAGKTTTIKLLVGLLEPDAGRALVAGHDVWAEPVAARAALGYVPDRAILYDRLTGREFLDFLAQLRGTPRREAGARTRELLALLDLAEHADLPCGTYSFGMKRKLALAGALLHRPAALILDEPLNGLDPRAARRVKRLLAGLAGDGTAILLSTHDLATAESICHRVGILHRGRLVAEGPTPELRRLAAAPDLEAVFLELTADEPEGREEAAV